MYLKETTTETLRRCHTWLTKRRSQSSPVGDTCPCPHATPPDTLPLHNSYETYDGCPRLFLCYCVFCPNQPNLATQDSARSEGSEVGKWQIRRPFDNDHTDQ